MKKYITSIQIISFFVFILLLHPVNAQSSSEGKMKVDQTEEKMHSGEAYNPLKKGVALWNGNASLQRRKYFRDQDDSRIQYEFSINIQYVKMITDKIGIGGAGFTDVYTEGFSKNFGMGSIALGPLVRGYVWQNSQLQTYIQTQILGGFNLALGDPLGTNEGAGFRVRPEIRAGLTYRISNTVGLFMEAGPAWEGELGNGLDSKGFQLLIGIQLLRF